MPSVPSGEEGPAEKRRPPGMADVDFISADQSLKVSIACCKLIPSQRPRTLGGSLKLNFHRKALIALWHDRVFSCAFCMILFYSMGNFLFSMFILLIVERDEKTATKFPRVSGCLWVF